jgi:hypothetical protein
MIAQVARRHQPKADRKITSNSGISKIQKAYYQFQGGLFSGLCHRQCGKQKNRRRCIPMTLRTRCIYGSITPSTAN